MKQILAAFLCMAMLFVVCACGTVPVAESTTAATSSETTTGWPSETTVTGESTTTATESTTPIETTATQSREELLAAAVKINATPVTTTKEIPLLVILVNYDADNDGVNDWDDSNPGKLYTDASKSYYGEQWASSAPENHYSNYFGDGYSLSKYYYELSLGAFRFVPIQFDVKPNSSCKDGVIEITVPIKHPTASGDAQGTLAAIVNACDPYIDFSKYDTNDNWVIDADELGILVLNPGADASSSSGKTCRNASSPRNYFEVWGTSQGLSAYCDSRSFTKVSNFGEFKTVGNIIPIGVPTHELAHNLGAEDLYDRSIGATGGTVTGWPRAYYFSLQCNGNNCGSGTMPSYLDPYQRVYLGWAESHVVEDGIYTISSTCSGNYVILRVNTPNPDEYYLIEVRLKESFESRLTSGTSQGGIMIWHIDEAVNHAYFASGMASSSYASAATGKRHDPGIVPLFRNAYDINGKLMTTTNPSDPFYYYSDDNTTSICNTGDFRSATNGSQSLNAYPSDWTGRKNFNISIEVLSEPGEEMTVKITSGRKDYAPRLSVTYDTKTYNSITVRGKVEWTDSDITSCGITLATNKEFTEGVITKEAYINDDGIFTYYFDGLTPDTQYYYKAYVESLGGHVEAVSDTKTNSMPQAKDYVTISFYRGLTSPDKAFTAKYKFGVAVTYKFPMVKAGYVFEGWYLDAAFTKPYDVQKAIPVGTDDFSLYAKWSVG